MSSETIESLAETIETVAKTNDILREKKAEIFNGFKNKKSNYKERIDEAVSIIENTVEIAQTIGDGEVIADSEFFYNFFKNLQTLIILEDKYSEIKKQGDKNRAKNAIPILENIIRNLPPDTELKELYEKRLHDFEYLSKKEDVKISYNSIAAAREKIPEIVFTAAKVDSNTYWNPITITVLNHATPEPPAEITHLLIQKIKEGISSRKFTNTNYPQISLRGKNGEAKSITPQEKRENRTKIEQDAAKKFTEDHGNLALIESGRLKLYHTNSPTWLKTKIIDGKIGQDYKGSVDVRCAELHNDIGNSLVPLPKGIVFAGDAWQIIPDMKERGVMKPIAFNSSRGYSLSKADYQSSQYQKELQAAYTSIKQGFQNSGLPMTLGAHYRYTSTDKPGGLLTQAYADHKSGKTLPNGHRKVPNKPSPNSHVFFMQKEYQVPLSINGKQSMRNIINAHWKKNRHPAVSAIPRAKLDFNSPLLRDIEVFQGGKKIGTVSSLINTQSTISGSIILKGIGVIDEIGKSVKGGGKTESVSDKIKQEFFALRMATTASDGKAMYTFAEAGQVHTKVLEQDEKRFNTVLSGKKLGSIKLGDQFPKYKAQYQEKVNYWKGKGLRSQQAQKTAKGNIYDLIKDDLIINGLNITPYSQLYHEAQFFYTHFFRISAVNKNTEIPLFKSKEDLQDAIANLKQELRSAGNTDIEINQEDFSVEIGKEKEISTLSKLIAHFVEKTGIQNINTENPQIKKVCIFFLTKIAAYNKKSYFEEEMKAVNGGKMNEKYFVQPSNIFYKEEMLEEFSAKLEQAKLQSDKENFSKVQHAMKDVPLEYMREKFGFPLTGEQLYEICDGNAYAMKALMMIAYRERYKGKWDAEKADSFMDWMTTQSKIRDGIDDLAATFKGRSSAGILQISLPSDEKILKQRTLLFIEKMDTLLEKGVVSFSTPQLQKRYETLKLRSKIKDYKFNNTRPLLRNILAYVPAANFVMGSIYIQEQKDTINSQLTNHSLSDEKIPEKEKVNFHVEGWSGPDRRRHHMTLSVLDKFIHTLGLQSSAIYKSIAIEEKQGKPLQREWHGNVQSSQRYRPFTEVEKGMLRIEKTTKAIVNALRKKDSSLSPIRNHFINTLEYNEESLQAFLTNVLRDIDNSRDKTMMEKSKSKYNFLTPNTFPHFADFFITLRSFDPKIAPNFSQSSNTSRKELGNYADRVHQDWKGMSKEGAKTGIGGSLHKKESEFTERENKLRLQDKVRKLARLITNKSINIKNDKTARIIQQALKNLGFYKDRIDGGFGENSYSALNTAIGLTLNVGDPITPKHVAELITKISEKDKQNHSFMGPRSPQEILKNEFPKNTVEILSDKWIKVHCTTQEAIQFSRNPKTHTALGQRVIYRVTDAKKPQNTKLTLNFYSVHGTAGNNTQNDIKTLSTSADAAYLVGTESMIFQFFDDMKGEGALGFNKNEINATTSAIELSLPSNAKNKFGITQPNTLEEEGKKQMLATNDLITLINKKNLPVITSRDPTRGYEQEAKKAWNGEAIHIDDFNEASRIAMGILPKEKAKDAIERFYEEK